MMNGALGASFYVAPWLDVLGAETGVRIPRNRLNYIRSITRHKPFLTLLKGNFEQQLGHEEIKTHMEQCLAYGIPPGLFDWMPSGLGPGGRYWDHPRYYERDRALFRKYQPLCSALAAAGWEPVTYARTSQPKVFVERFGPTTDGIIWLSLLNEDKQDLKTTVEIDPEQLQLKGGPVRAVEVVAERPVHPAESGDTLQTELEMPAGGVRVLQITRPMAAARWRIAQALGVLDRGIRMRQLDVARPALPVHWRPAAGTVSRDSSGGKTNLVLRGDKASAVSASQWVMLFQSEAKELKLRVRAKGENISGQEGTASIVCRLARVTPSFTHYESRQLDLPSGTYDWKDFELPIRSAQPLRAIQVTPQLAKGAQGALHLAAIGISDAGTPQYVADPEFAEWYEPLPAELRPLLDENCLAIRTELLRLQDAPGPEGIAAIDRRIQALRETIARAKAENGCRRVLRDLETVEHHLNQAL